VKKSLLLHNSAETIVKKRSSQKGCFFQYPARDLIWVEKG